MKLCPWVSVRDGWQQILQPLRQINNYILDIMMKIRREEEKIGKKSALTFILIE